MNTSLFDALGYVQRGKVDIAFLAAAEIDQYGNLNATVVGDYCTRFVAYREAVALMIWGLARKK